MGKVVFTANWYRQPLLLTGVIIVVLFVAGELLSPGFAAPRQIVYLLVTASLLGFVAAGQNLVILGGREGIDLSVGSVFACSAVVGGMLFQNTGNLFLSLISTIGFGALLGFANGLMITRLRVPPFIATLGMMGIARGFALIFSRGIPIYGLDERYRWIGQARIANVIPVPT